MYFIFVCTNSFILHPKQIHSDWFFWVFKKKYLNILIDYMYYKGNKFFALNFLQMR